MKAFSIALALFLTVGCQSSADINDHWNTGSVGPRMGRALLGYDSSRDGSYRDFADERKRSISLTLRRHLFNHNPDNPNHPMTTTYGDEGSSWLPNPVGYVHVEGLILGVIPLALTGTYFPLPIDSLIGTLEGINEGSDG